MQQEREKKKLSWPYTRPDGQIVDNKQVESDNSQAIGSDFKYWF